MLKVPDRIFTFYIIDLAAVKGSENAESGEGLICKVPLPDDNRDSFIRDDACEIADQLKTLAWISHDSLLPISANYLFHPNPSRYSVSSTTTYIDPDRYSYSYATDKMLYTVRIDDNLLLALACHLSGPNQPPLIPIALLSQLLDSLYILFVAGHGHIRDFIHREFADNKISPSPQFATNSLPISSGTLSSKRVSLEEVIIQFY